MRDAVGIMSRCEYCNKMYYCTDGGQYCSTKCSLKHDGELYAQGMEEVKSVMEGIVEDYKLGYYTDEEYKKEMEDLAIWANDDWGLDEDDLKKLRRELNAKKI
jgi:hypothetical protein